MIVKPDHKYSDPHKTMQHTAATGLTPVKRPLKRSVKRPVREVGGTISWAEYIEDKTQDKEGCHQGVAFEPILSTGCVDKMLSNSVIKDESPWLARQEAS